MLENLTDRMSTAIRNIRGLGKISEDNISEALKEVQNALLSADVHFRVAKEFIQNVKEDCLGQEVVKSVSPGQLIVKIINDRLIEILGEGAQSLSGNKPLKVLMVGLHGSGKTTSSVKLAINLKKQGYSPALVACDIYRPAAIDQLEQLAKKHEFPVYAERETKNVPKLGKNALSWAKEVNADAIIFDTAGRLQVDEELVQEVVDLKKVVSPEEVLLVADSALGQEAVNVAKHFNDAVSLTGIVLTKLDGDARGGAALSMKSITGAPIKFIGTGEKIEDLERFHPERMAQRILGMGDVVSLVEKAQENIDKDHAEKMAQKVKKADFNFQDLLDQMQQIKKMGSLSSLAGMLPGAGKMEMGAAEETQMKRTEAIVQSMTPQERENPKIMNGNRRLRIANGAGVKVKDVNQLIKQLQQMRKMMKSMKGGKNKQMMKQMQAMAGSGGLPPGLSL